MLSELRCQHPESHMEHIFSVYSVWETVQTSLGRLSIQESFENFSFTLPDACVSLHTSQWMGLIQGEFSDASSFLRPSGVIFECDVNTGISIKEKLNAEL